LSTTKKKTKKNNHIFGTLIMFETHFIQLAPLENDYIIILFAEFYGKSFYFAINVSDLET